MYEALYCVATRDFKRAAELFLDSLSTFTTTELFSYKKFIFYTVLTAIIALDRVTLRKQVLHAPEVLTVLSDIPHLGPLLNGLYNCKYGEYMDAFQRLSAVVSADLFLNRHYRYILREGRVVAYSQARATFVRKRKKEGFCTPCTHLVRAQHAHRTLATQALRRRVGVRRLKHRPFLTSASAVPGVVQVRDAGQHGRGLRGLPRVHRPGGVRFHRVRPPQLQNRQGALKL